MRKLLISLVVLPGLLYGGVKGYLWYKTREAADQLVESASPFAVITYDGIHSSLKGSVGIDNVIIRPRGVRDEIRVDSVTFHAPDLRFLISAERRLENKKLPESLGISLKGVTMDLQGPLVAETASGGQNLTFSPLSALGCGDLATIGPRELLSMGYDNIVYDLDLNYRLQPDGNGVDLTVSSDAHDMAFMQLGMQVDLPGLNGAVTNAIGVQPQIKRAELIYRDYDLNPRLTRFCAASMDAEPAQFLDGHTSLVAVRLHELGVQPSPELMQAYRGFMEKSGDLRIVFAPDQPLQPAELALYDTQALVRVLHPQLTINGAPLAVHPASGPAPIAKGVRPQPKAEEKPRIELPKYATPAYHVTPVSELSGHLGRPVRLRLTSGQDYDGTLEELRNDSLLIRRRLYGGSITQPVDLAEVAEIQVLYLKQ